jgi:uncharacterized lipoprotein
MRYLIHIIVCLLPLTLAGCGYFSVQGRDKHYLNAQSTQPLRIPPGVSGSAFHNDYPISDRNYPDSVKTVNITPPGLNSGN